MPNLRNHRASDEASTLKSFANVDRDLVRERYGINFGEITLQRRGEVFDTFKIFKHFYQKPNRKHRLGLVRIRDAEKFDGPDLVRMWSSALIWVCVNGEEIFSHICKPDRFHHSSFTGDQGVTGAGMWIVKNGIIQGISALSGHFRPRIGPLHRTVRMLANAGVLNGAARVLVWDPREEKWVFVNALDFANSARPEQYTTSPPR